MAVPAQKSHHAAERWSRDLADWRIPDEILTAAPQSPWIHPVELFRAPDEPVPDSPSHARARQRLDAGGSVLDIGCGGGRAAFAVAPPAAVVTGVDRNIPHTKLRERLTEVPPGLPVRVYCASGFRSYLALRVLRQTGWHDVASLSGGLTTLRLERPDLTLAPGSAPIRLASTIR